MKAIEPTERDRPLHRDFRAGLCAAGMAVSLAHKAIAIRPSQVFLSWAIDAGVFAGLLLAVRAVPFTRRAMRVLASSLLFYLPFYAVFICSFAYAFFFDSAAERHFSLLDVGGTGIAYFFRRVLPVRGWLVLGLQLGLIHAGAFAWVRRAHPLRPRLLFACALGLGLPASVAAARAELVPSPLADIAHDLLERLRAPEVPLAPGLRPPYPTASLEGRERPAERINPRFKRVLVFVMETMTAKKFDAERSELPATTFANAAASHAARYANYFPTNQDSRTGMLAMLSSRLIPYEAYTEHDRDRYKRLADRPSLVDRFNALGYTSAFVESQTELEIVIGDLPWSQTLVLSDRDVRAAGGRALCFEPFEFEKGCEDRVMLPRVLELIDKHERLFLVQEFIWGHDLLYNDASGKTNTEYYSEYLDAVVAHLRATGKLGETLIALTSDHGLRDRMLQDRSDVYRIPLLLYAENLAPHADARLFTHADFGALLDHALDPNAPDPSGRPFAMVVGTTTTGLLTVLGPSHQPLLLRTRQGVRYLIEDQRPPSERSVTPAEYFVLFDAYRRSFDAYLAPPELAAPASAPAALGATQPYRP